MNLKHFTVITQFITHIGAQINLKVFKYLHLDDTAYLELLALLD